MAVFYSIDGLPHFHNAVLTVGTFDGVHKGHRAILDEVNRHAANVGGESVLITFDPHPRKLLFPEQRLGLITSLRDKIDLVTAAGIQHVVVVPFNREFAAMRASEYISQFLVGIFHPHSIVIGYDHKFGNDRAGDFRLLETCAPEHGYQLIEIPPLLIQHAAVSSTKIRHAIEAGDMDIVAAMTGRYFAIEGEVIDGKKLGRTIGFPTANIKMSDPEQIIPAIGVYAVIVKHNDVSYKAMLNIGYNPTITNTRQLHIEANLFDFDKTIYGELLRIQFVRFIREERKFDSLVALKEQLNIDRSIAQRVLKEL